MSSLGIIYALLTVLICGVCLTLSGTDPSKGQQIRTFYATLAVILIAPAIAYGKLISGSIADDPHMICTDPEDDSATCQIFTSGVMQENVPALCGNKVYTHFDIKWHCTI